MLRPCSFWPCSFWAWSFWVGMASANKKTWGVPDRLPRFSNIRVCPDLDMPSCGWLWQRGAAVYLPPAPPDRLAWLRRDWAAMWPCS